MVTRAEAAVFIHRADAVYHLTPHEFDKKVIAEKDGVQFEIMLNQTSQKLYVDAKVTNISEKAIPYFGRDGCDPGVSVNLTAERDSQNVRVGGTMRNPILNCTMAAYQDSLGPNETIQTFEVLIPPKEGFKENHHVKVSLKNGPLNGTSTSSPIEITIPLNVE